MHPGAYDFVARVSDTYQAQGPVYEIGSRNINGSVRNLFRNVGLYIGVDMLPGPGVDLMVNALQYDPPMTPATVVCCEVLEHTREAQQLVQKAASVLASGGLLILTMAGDGRAPHSAVDGGRLRDGEFYQNVGRDDLDHWTTSAGVDALELTANPRAGDLYFIGRKR